MAEEAVGEKGREAEAHRGLRRKRCKGCGAVVVWATTHATGTGMPVDPEPVTGGNVELFVPPGSREPIAFVVGEGDDRDSAPRLFEIEERVRYKPHWDTCPEADRLRRRGKSEP